VDVAGGGSHSLALTDTGQVFAFGFGSSGQLGQGTTASSSVPVAVSGLTNVVAIAAGANHSLAVTAAGEVWAWGDNASNQVAPGATTDHLVPTLVAQVTDAVAVAAGSSHSLARYAATAPSGCGAAAPPVNSVWGIRPTSRPRCPCPA